MIIYTSLSSLRILLTSIAQMVEHQSHKLNVRGSIPRANKCRQDIN